MRCRRVTAEVDLHKGVVILIKFEELLHERVFESLKEQNDLRDIFVQALCPFADKVQVLCEEELFLG